MNEKRGFLARVGDYCRKVSGGALAAVSAVGVGAMVTAGDAAAQLDVTGISGAFSDAGTAIAAVGLAMLAAAGAGIAIKWVLGWLF